MADKEPRLGGREERKAMDGPRKGPRRVSVTDPRRNQVAGNNQFLQDPPPLENLISYIVAPTPPKIEARNPSSGGRP